MPRIDVVLTKEQLDANHKNNPTTIAVVLDIIFATSSITAALEIGVKKIYVANDLAQAEQISNGLDCPHEIAGESMAQAFDGYRSYEPLALSDPALANKSIVYATTNGTVALGKTKNFYKTYTASLRNAASVAKHVLSDLTDDKNILLICSGSNGRFSLEDFYGAGCLVANIIKKADFDLVLSDTANAANLLFANTDPYQVLSASRLGEYFTQLGKQNNLEFISQINVSEVVGVMRNGVVVGF